MLNATGNEVIAAATAVASAKTKIPSVSEIVLQHIDHPNSVSPGHLSKYRHYVRDHIEGVLGIIPVDKVTYLDVMKWDRALTDKACRRRR